MKFTKSQFKFLEMFTFAAESRGQVQQNVLFELKGNMVTVYQVADTITLVKQFEVENEAGEEFEMSLPVVAFYDLIRVLKSEEFDLTKGEIVFNKGRSRYQFETTEAKPRPYQDVMAILDRKSDLTVAIPEFKKVNQIRAWIGDKELGAVDVNQNYIVSAFDRKVVSYVKMESSVGTRLSIPKRIVEFLEKFGGENVSLSVYEDDNLFYSHVQDVHAFMPRHDYALPDVTSNGFSSNVPKETKAVVDRIDFADTLNRLWIVTKAMPNSKVAMKFDVDSITFESKEFNKSKEVVDASVDADLVGAEVNISAEKMKKVVSEMGTENVDVYYVKEGKVVCVEDSTGDHTTILSRITE